MSKVVLMSLLVGTLVLPIRAARAPSARQALRRLVVASVLFHLAYVLAVVFLYPRLG